MTIEDIKQLIADDEHRTLELKKNDRRVEGRYAVCLCLSKYRGRMADIRYCTYIAKDCGADGNRQHTTGVGTSII